MKQIMKTLWLIGFVLTGLPVATAPAAPRDASGSNKIVLKMQAMIKEMTVERDLLKTEKDKLALEIEQLKKDKAAAALAEDRLSSELAAQKNSNAAVSNTLAQTHAKLLEVIDKYNALNQAKNELSATHANLQNTLKQTETELQSCETKNIKMFEAAKEVLNSYENRGLMDTLLKSEPVFQFKSVEMESIIQEYEDKLIKQKYQHKELTATNKTTPETKEAQEPQQP
jgi:septum formation topological specificity factor MinE